MGNIRLDLSTEAHIVNGSPGGITQVVVSIRNLQETLFGLFVSWIGSGMACESQFFIGSFDLVNGCISSHTQNLIIALLLLRVMLFKELFLVFIDHSSVLIEPVEDFEGVVNGVVGRCQHVILVSPGRIGKVDVGLGNLIEPSLCSLPVIGVFLRMVLGG